MNEACYAISGWNGIGIASYGFKPLSRKHINFVWASIL
ncbi:hypothetical protein P872_17155 [Rhodonellum psychrophilum GCM71 = DSM 17998]|uniref:Uncharacterized protein n=1 Tax=Rhodonellum psychrophilum GCM71 = DSM 17998 TaxID=1123057 RepID=U5BI75_9BACT|nr:hypothetical protein P872_17155 [Rhodonellum psychrophilum GCM71 = DSM 17998]